MIKEMDSRRIKFLYRFFLWGDMSLIIMKYLFADDRRIMGYIE